MDITLNNSYGSSTGNLIYSVLIFDEDDMSSSSIKMYCANDYDEVEKYVKEDNPDLSEDWYIIREIGSRILTSADL